MSFKDQIQEILERFCSKNSSLNNEQLLGSFKLVYLEQTRVSYLKNLSVIANYLKRDEKQILKYIQPRGLKIYTLEYKNEVIYGFMINLQMKKRLQDNLDKYIKFIKCKNCNSRFTELNFENPNNPYTYCKSCGSKNL